MRRPSARSLALAACALAAALPAAADDAAAAGPAIGERVAELRFVDTRYLERSLTELGERPAYVIAFTTTTCPLARRYLPRLAAMERSYRDRGVAFLAVNVGPGDTVIDVAQQAVEQDVPFPCVKDFDHSVAAAVGATRTPEVVVLDAERRLRYRGRIDGQYRVGGVRPDAGRADLREALDDVLAGREVRVPETPVDGCRITPPAPPETEVEVTYHRDVAPILQEHCIDCHRPGTEAPFPLLTYDDAWTVSSMIAEVVEQRRMPPWYAVEGPETFTNHRGLSDEEVATVLAWVAQGTPEGDPADGPPAPDLPDTGGWQIGEPDLVITQSDTTELPAEGYVDYQYVILPHVFAEDTWVDQIQILPANSEVVHHCNMAYLIPGEDGLGETTFLTGKVPGSGPMKLRDGVALEIPAGASLVLQVHYITTGEPETDRLSVGFRFPREPVRKRLRHLIVRDRDFEIPAEAPAHEVRDARTVPVDAVGAGLFAHMHLRGRDMTFRARYPDGETEALLRIPNYSFDWQLGYSWPDGPDAKRFPQGTRIECVGHFDNSPFNPYNPGPEDAVRWGEQTYHEMFYGFFFYVAADEDLGLRIDPETGTVRDAAPADEEPAGRRYY